MKKQLNNERGFALVEGVLVLVIVGAIAGMGLYVMNQKNAASDQYNNAVNDTVGGSNKASLSADKIGTVSGVEAVGLASDENDSKVEQEIETDSVNHALSDQSAANNVGDSINENSL